MARHVAKELNLSGYDAVEDFLKEVASFKLTKEARQIENFHLQEGGIIFFNEKGEPIAFSHGARGNNMLTVWLVSMYKANGEYSPESAPICEDIIYEAWRAYELKIDKVTFVQDDNSISNGMLYDANGVSVNDAIYDDYGCLIGTYIAGDINDITYMVSIENGLDNAQVKEFLSFEEALNFFEAYEKKLMEEEISLIQVIGYSHVILKVSRGHLFNDYMSDLDLLDD